jgi:hypothetical protein
MPPRVKPPTDPPALKPSRLEISAIAVIVTFSCACLNVSAMA